MKLWVDDLRIPPAPAEGEEPWVWVKTIGAAIRHLRTGTVTDLALDHDLGGRREGRRVSQWVERKAVAGELPHLRWQILSDNPAGRREIYEGMHRAGMAWFQQFVDTLPDPGTRGLAFGEPPVRRVENEPEVLDVVQEASEECCRDDDLHPDGVLPPLLRG